MKRKIIFWMIAVFILFILLWKLTILVMKFPEFILPQPETVFITWIVLLKKGLILSHTWATLYETLIGFLIGSVLGLIPGYFIAKSKLVEQTLSPYIVAAQAAPKIALAPLIVVWLGFGVLSKIVISALIVFFPVLMNTIVGIRSIDKNLLELMKILKANRIQIFLKLELPSSLPILFAAFKVGITFALVGAVVGEFVGANSGLGYLTIYAAGMMDTPQVFAVLLQLTLIGILLYLSIDLLEHLAIPWYKKHEKDVIFS